MKFESVQSLDSQSFVGLDQQGAVIQSREFHASTFRNCQFNETVFQAAVFIECVFEECDLSLVRIPDVTFRETRFINSKLVGINWTEADWGQSGLLKRKFVDFHRCILDYSTFLELSLADAQIYACSAKQVAFEGADLSGADCRKTDFKLSRFVRTNLTKADFTGAINYDIDAQLNTVHKTKFSLPEAVSLLRSLDIILAE